MANEGSRFCQHCGAKQEMLGAKFCCACGKPLPAHAAPVPPVSPAPTVTLPPSLTGPTRSQRARETRGSKQLVSEVAKPPPNAQPRRFSILRLRVLFGLFDIIALLLLAAGYGIWQLKPETSSCEPLELPASHTVVDSRDSLAGEVAGFSVLEAGRIYTVAADRSLTVPEGATLLIEAGARLVFEPGAALDVHGRLHACGTGRETIIFTSSRDLEGSDEGRPKAGDWVGIRFYPDSDERSVIGNARIRYAGHKNHGGVHLEAASPRIADVTISDCAWFPISCDADSDPALGGEIAMENVPYVAIELRKSTLSRNLEWADTDHVYVVTDRLTVGDNATLTIQPGVAIKFASGAALVVEGRLQAVGRLGDSTEAIVLTSIRDDSVRGDTDLAAADPKPGDWLGVVFKESSRGSVLREVSIRYAGNAEHGVAAIHLEAASPEIVANEISHSASYAISADARSNPTVQGNRLEDIALGVGLGIRGSALTGREAYEWNPTNIDLIRVVAGKVTVDPEASLTIAPGTILKFTDQGGLEVNGFLYAEGGEAENARIVFTSVHDDDYGGDTDGRADPQASRAWGWIVLRGSDSSTIIRRAVIRYAGISLVEASPQILDNYLLDGNGYAMKADPNSDPVVQGNTVTGNDIDGIEIWEGQLTARGEWIWDSSKVTLVRVVTGRVIVSPETMLVIRPATVVKFADRGQLYIRGGLRIEGEQKQPVVLTSWRDDEHGGDTDGSTIQPQPGDWQGIEFDASSSDSASSLEQLVVRYAKVGLSLTDSSPSMRNIRIEYGSSQGLVCDSRSNPLLDAVILENNAEAGSNCPDWKGNP